MKRINVAAAVILDGERILAVERGYGNYMGYWEFPGGKIEEGETGSDALHRELREELDCEVRIVEELQNVEWDYPEFHLSMQCFLCHLISGFTLKEHLHYRWLSAKELNDVKWLPADLSVIEEIKKRISTSL